MLVTLTRAEATAKQLDEGQPVWIKAVAGASQIASYRRRAGGVRPGGPVGGAELTTGLHATVSPAVDDGDDEGRS